METSEEHPELMPVPPPLKPSLVGWKLDKHGLVLAGDGVLETFLVGWEPYPDPGRGDAGSALNPSFGGEAIYRVGAKCKEDHWKPEGAWNSNLWRRPLSITTAGRKNAVRFHPPRARSGHIFCAVVMERLPNFGR